MIVVIQAIKLCAAIGVGAYLSRSLPTPSPIPATTATGQSQQQLTTPTVLSSTAFNTYCFNLLTSLFWDIIQ